MFDVICFGSATQDIYLKSNKFAPNAEQKICLPSATKIKMDGIAFSTGGGGTNAAVTFARQGLAVAYCGMVGDDHFGKLAIEELKRLKIDTGFIKKTNKRSTNISVILSHPDGEKTILVHRGAADILSKKDIPWAEIKNTRWFYLAPFSGKLAGLTQELVDFAKKNKIKVALNPGYNQLTMTRPTLERIFEKIDILILNREEASLLTKIPYQREKEVFKKLDKLAGGIYIMTKGEKGVVVSDGKYLYKADALKIKLMDSTGAGDSFNAGFLSAFIKTGDIVSAMQLGIANSASNLQKLGAKDGLLDKNQKFKKVKVIKIKC